jgi:hypothetical protein
MSFVIRVQRYNLFLSCKYPYVFFRIYFLDSKPYFAQNTLVNNNLTQPKIYAKYAILALPWQH